MMTVSDGPCSKCKKYRTRITETIHGDRYICVECIKEKTVSKEAIAIDVIPEFHAGGIVPEDEPIAILHGCEPVLYLSLAHLFGIYVFDKQFMRTYYPKYEPDLNLPDPELVIQDTNERCPGNFHGNLSLDMKSLLPTTFFEKEDNDPLEGLDMNDYIIDMDELWLTGPESKKRMESDSIENVDDSEDILGFDLLHDPKTLWQRIKTYFHHRKYPPYVNLNLPNDADSKIDEYSKELKDWTEHVMGEKGNTEDSFTHVIKPLGIPRPLNYYQLKELSDNNEIVQIALKAKIDHIPGRESRWQRIKNWWANKIRSGDD